MKNFNTARKALDNENTSQISIFEYISHKRKWENAKDYYAACETIFYTLNNSDIEDIHLLLSQSKYEIDDFLLFATISLCTADLNYLELLIRKMDIRASCKLDYLNTLKKVTFDFRKKIKPTYLKNLSYLYIDSINRSAVQRDSFRKEISDKAIDDLKIQNSVKHEDSLVILLEEIQERTLSTVNKLIFDWVYILNKENPDLKIKVLVINDFKASQGGFPFGFSANETITLDKIYKEFGLALKVQNNVELTFRPENKPSFQWVVENLENISPQAVLCFPNPQWPLLKVLKNYVPIIGVELANGVNLKDMCTIVLPNGKPNKHTKEKYGDMLYDIEFPSIAFKKQTNYTKYQFGLSDQTPLIISLGRQLFERSAIDLKQYFLRIKYFLEENKTCSFIFVGEEQPVITGQLGLQKFIDTKRMIFISNEQDIMSLLNICDVFAMPPIKGGGRGIGLAASLSIPCVSFDISDGAKSLPAHLIYKLTDLEGYFGKITSLLNDSAQYNRESHICSQIFTDELFSKISTDTIKAIKLARVTFNEELS